MYEVTEIGFPASWRGPQVICWYIGDRLGEAVVAYTTAQKPALLAPPAQGAVLTLTRKGRMLARSRYEGRWLRS